MNRKFKSLIMIIGLIICLSPFAYAKQITLAVPEIFQEHSQWCWAAVSESVLAYHAQTPSQCDIADWAWIRSDCCSNTTFNWSHACNQPNSLYSSSGSIQNILKNWSVGPASIAIANELTWNKVVSEINANTPFVIRFGWTSGGGHFLTGYGYDDASPNSVLYMDPWPGNGYTKSTYSFVVSASDHSWTHTLYNLTGSTSLTCAAPNSISVPESNTSGSYSVSWGASATSAVTYVLEEATNASFSNNLRSAYSGSNTNAYITARSKGTTYYYRVKATKSGYSDSDWRIGDNGCEITSGGCN